MSSLNSLPIDAHCAEILSQVQEGIPMLLIAAPGTGKSTRVPPFLSKHLGKTLLIEPRRTAAKMLAYRIAEEWGCKVGEEVGYQIRFDAHYSEMTQLLIVTEGIARQRMISDPFLEEFSVVILDEAHERSLQSDIILGFFHELRSIRPELHILLLSATIQPEPYMDFFDQQLRVDYVEGTHFDVSIHYEEQVSSQSFAERLHKHICTALTHIQSHESILVFLPGKKDIEEAIANNQFASHQSLPLYSALPFSQQQLLFQNFPKIIFSTNVAESSLTLPNIGAVIDSGEEKIGIDLGGFSQLQTVEISMESADQRAGRAGRTQEGHCFRMWRSSARRRNARRPEIMHSDISQALLHILDWGISIEDFRWLTPPTKERLQTALSQLRSLSLIDDNGITPKGREIARIPIHPRIGCVLYEAHTHNVLKACARMATAFLQEQRIDARSWKQLCHTEPQTKEQRKIYTQLLGFFPSSSEHFDAQSIQVSWMAGFADRIARPTAHPHRYLLSDGSEAYCKESYDWFLAIQLHKNEQHMRSISGGIPLAEALIPTKTQTIHMWKEDHVEALEQTKVGHIILKEQNVRVDIHIAQTILAEKAEEKTAYKHTKESLSLYKRIEYCRSHMEFPTLSQLLPELCIGKKSIAELQALPLHTVLSEQLTWEQTQCLNTHAPQHFHTPSKALINIEYTEEGPIVRARIQQLFGLHKHPKIANTPIIFELLAPNNRPQQRTQDIASFWSGSYQQIRKELRGRYPKHAWPEHPCIADAQNHPQKKSQQ